METLLEQPPIGNEIFTLFMVSSLLVLEIITTRYFHFQGSRLQNWYTHHHLSAQLNTYTIILKLTNISSLEKKMNKSLIIINTHPFGLMSICCCQMGHLDSRCSSFKKKAFKAYIRNRMMFQVGFIYVHWHPSSYQNYL